MMINWFFIAIVSIVIAAMVELVKKLPFLKKTWKHEQLRCVVIWLIAFAISVVITYFVGLGFGLVTSALQAISYAVVAFFLQKFLGEEFMHKLLNEYAGA